MDAVNRNLWTAALRREQLVELLEGRGPRPTRDDPTRLRLTAGGKELLGVWVAEDDRSLSPLPQILIAERTVLDDLFAWSASYLRALGPLSAITRPLTPNQFEALLNRRLPQEPWKVAGGAVGLVICEVMALSEGIEMEGAAGATPNSTLSFAILRAWSLGLPLEAIDEISDGFTRLSHEMQRLLPKNIVRGVEEITTALLGVDHDGNRIGLPLQRARHWMHDLRSGANIYELACEVLRQSTDLLSDHDVVHLEEMTAEKRVQFFDALTPSLVASVTNENRLDSAFALALAAFICRPGLEQQASLLTDHAQLLPESWLWLGALQAFAPISEVLSVGSGAGWRIARELFRPEDPWAAPRADAALTEIDVLSRSKSKIFQRLLERSQLDVEIYPMITTAIRGMNAAAEQRRNEEGTRAKYVASRDAAASGKLELVEARLEESLRLVRGLRRNDEGPGSRPTRRRR